MQLAQQVDVLGLEEALGEDRAQPGRASFGCERALEAHGDVELLAREEPALERFGDDRVEGVGASSVRHAHECSGLVTRR
jgi:hypothetical protein